MNDDSSFVSLNLAQVQNDLLRLYQRIACEKGRVEIVSPDRNECECVLISKAELDGLERAIELLANADGVRALAAEVANIAHAAEPAQTGA